MARKLKRTETGPIDAAWLDNTVNNPYVTVTDNTTGKDVQKDDLKSLVNDQPDTSATKKTEKLSEDVQQQTEKDKPVDEQKQKEDQKKTDQKKEDLRKDQKSSADRTAKKLSGTNKPVNKALSGVNDALDAPIQKVGQATNFIQTLKTPGGIGFLVVLLIFLLFVVVKVNQVGDTRIKQFWFLLNGKAHLDKSGLPANVGSIQNTTNPGSSTGTPGSQSNPTTTPGTGSTPSTVPWYLQPGYDVGGWIQNVTGLDYTSPNTFRTGGGI